MGIVIVMGISHTSHIFTHAVPNGVMVAHHAFVVKKVVVEVFLIKGIREKTA